MSKILVTRRIPQPGLDRLSKVFDEVVVFSGDRDMTKAELLQALPDCDILIPMLSNRIDQEVMDCAPALRGICNYAAGFNNIDLDYAKQKGIIVTNTPDVLTESTADLTWALLLAAARRLTEADAMLRRGEFKGWEPLLLLGQDVFSKTLGIIGMGRIGLAVAVRALGFNMKILYYKSSGAVADLPFAAEYVPLDELLQRSDFVSIHTPLTPQTRHLIGERELALMKPSAVLVNTSRGPVIDEQALVKALREKRIFAAGLDVFEAEPELAEGLKELPNTVLLPHIGSASLETRSTMALLAADNAIAILRGEQPLTPVL
jgi:lactate dehydrogenase-like 2-hydroxyacid dehydrogenase